MSNGDRWPVGMTRFEHVCKDVERLVALGEAESVKPKPTALLLQEREDILPVLEAFDALDAKVGLEIGFGYGGTHRLFRQLCSELFVTVELKPGFVIPECPAARVGATGAMWEKHAVPDVWGNNSAAFFGRPSTDPKVVAAVVATVDGSIDFLYIDGDHTKAGAFGDWQAYAPFVRPGGLIGLHDTKSPELGPWHLVKAVRDGVRPWAKVESEGPNHALIRIAGEVDHV